MDGFGKVKPLTEGYVVKGGVNTTSRITTRPPAPTPIRQGNATGTATPTQRPDAKS
jgi:hypothetical protein